MFRMSAGNGRGRNRLPRGRAYVRNGSVVDLQIAEGEVSARVSGSSLYKVRIDITPVPKGRWKSICRDCAGGIDSLVELLQGRFSKGVMERICRQRSGLFPAPEEIRFSCSCPDWASMCKHIAAVAYGVEARLDERPELLFRPRNLDEKELLAGAAAGLPLSRKKPRADIALPENRAWQAPDNDPGRVACNLAQLSPGMLEQPLEGAKGTFGYATLDIKIGLQQAGKSGASWFGIIQPGCAGCAGS